MAVGFAIATSAFLAAFGKYFSKRWFFWFIAAVIATIAGMLMNAGNKRPVDHADPDQPFFFFSIFCCALFIA